MYEQPIFNAVVDAKPSNTFTPMEVMAAWQNLLTLRSPGLVGMNPSLGPQDRPFLGEGAANLPDTDVQTGAATTGGMFPPMYTPRGRGLQDTLFRRPQNSALGLFQTAGVDQNGVAHPYLQDEMLTKIYNNLTTRSNVFAVWLTVGFFEVMDDTTSPPKLGAEIGKANGTEIRHRFFSIIDRTQLVLPVLTRVNNPINAGANTLITPQQMTGNVTYSGTPGSMVPWAIVGPNAATGQVGSVLIIDRGLPNEETVVVTSTPMPNQFTADFQRPHGANFTITMPGNPGPQPRFDLSDPAFRPVIPFATTIE
jgi:hypothetical protein